MSENVHFLNPENAGANGRSAGQRTADRDLALAAIFVLSGVSGMVGLMFGWRAGLFVMCLWLAASGFFLASNAVRKDSGGAEKDGPELAEAKVDA